MPYNLEEFRETSERESGKQYRNLFMRLIEINDDLWHLIRLELEIKFLTRIKNSFHGESVELLANRRA